MENQNNHLQKNSLKVQHRDLYKNPVEAYNKTIKVRDVAEDNKMFWTKARFALSECSMMLGSKAAPTDEEYFLLKKVLIESFIDFSPEEILLAFNKLIAGKLNVEADKYGKLSAAYLGQVLLSYRALRNKALADSLKEQAKIEIKTELTPVERSKIREDFLNNCLIVPYGKIKELGKFDVDKVTAVMLFKLFRRAELIDVNLEDNDIYEEKAIQDLQNDAKNDFKTHKPMQKHLTGIRDMLKGENKSMQRTVSERACALYLYDYVMKLSKNNRDINEISKKL